MIKITIKTKIFSQRIEHYSFPLNLNHNLNLIFLISSIQPDRSAVGRS